MLSLWSGRRASGQWIVPESLPAVLVVQARRYRARRPVRRLRRDDGAHCRRARRPARMDDRASLHAMRCAPTQQGRPKRPRSARQLQDAPGSSKTSRAAGHELSSAALFQGRGVFQLPELMVQPSGPEAHRLGEVRGAEPFCWGGSLVRPVRTLQASGVKAHPRARPARWSPAGWLARRAG